MTFEDCNLVGYCPTHIEETCDGKGILIGADQRCPGHRDFSYYKKLKNRLIELKISLKPRRYNLVEVQFK